MSGCYGLSSRRSTANFTFAPPASATTWRNHSKSTWSMRRSASLRSACCCCTKNRGVIEHCAACDHGLFIAVAYAYPTTSVVGKPYPILRNAWMVRDACISNLSRLVLCQEVQKGSRASVPRTCAATCRATTSCAIRLSEQTQGYLK